MYKPCQLPVFIGSYRRHPHFQLSSFFSELTPTLRYYEKFSPEYFEDLKSTIGFPKTVITSREGAALFFPQRRPAFSGNHGIMIFTLVLSPLVVLGSGKFCVTKDQVLGLFSLLLGFLKNPGILHFYCRLFLLPSLSLCFAQENCMFTSLGHSAETPRSLKMKSLQKQNLT